MANYKSDKETQKGILAKTFVFFVFPRGTANILKTFADAYRRCVAMCLSSSTSRDVSELPWILECFDLEVLVLVELELTSRQQCSRTLFLVGRNDDLNT